MKKEESLQDEKPNEWLKKPGGIEQAFFTKLLTCTVQEYAELGLNEAFFVTTEHKSLFCFIDNHIKKYLILPNRETIYEAKLAEFGEFDLQIHEPLGFYFDKLLQRQTHKVYNSMLKECADLIKEKKHDELSKRIRIALVDASKLDRNNHKQITSADFKSVYAKKSIKKFKQLGICTGYSHVDQGNSALNPGDVGVVGGRPNTGKTYVATYIACNSSIRQNKKVVFYSMEMSTEQLTLRYAAIRNKYPITEINRSEVATIQLKKMIEVMKSDPQPVIFIGNEKLHTLQSISDIVTIHQPDFLILDAAYLIQIESKRHLSGYEKIVETIKGVKRLATELQIPVLCTYQLNRESKKIKKENEGVLDLSAIAGADDIGQLASIAIFLDEDDDSGERLLHLAKHRDGQKCSFRINWDFENMNFSEINSIEGEAVNESFKEAA
jgi:replicative DNA helicase